MTKNTKHVQAWLNWEYDLERVALEAFVAKVSQGYKPRDIITDALVRSQDSIPEYYHEMGEVQSQLKRIEEKLERNHEAILNQFYDMMQAIKSNPVTRKALIDDLENDTPVLGDAVRNNIAHVYRQAKDRK